MPSDKRRRQKENRSAAQAARTAALRRRRLQRTGLGVLVVAALVLIALVWGPQQKTAVKQPGKHPAAGATHNPSRLRPRNVSALPPGCKDEPRPQPGPTALPSPAPGAYVSGRHPLHAVIHTNCGDISVTLFPAQAPVAVNNFVYLARKGFYDGLYWHRIVRNFVIQTGDPNGVNGVPPDGPGYTIKDEFPPRARVYTFGAVAMANTGQPHSGGSQFFIVVHEDKTKQGPGRYRQPAGLKAAYTLFGRVQPSSFPVLERIANTPVVGGTGPNQSEPVAPVFITGISVSD